MKHFLMIYLVNSGCLVWSFVCFLALFGEGVVLFGDQVSCGPNCIQAHYITKDGLQLLILLPLPPRCWITGLWYHTQFAGTRDQIWGSMYARQEFYNQSRGSAPWVPFLYSLQSIPSYVFKVLRKEKLAPSALTIGTNRGECFSSRFNKNSSKGQEEIRAHCGLATTISCFGSLAPVQWC